MKMSAIVPIILLLVIAAFALMGIVLWYHWWRFALQPERGAVWLFIYVVVGLVFIGMMIAAANAL